MPRTRGVKIEGLKRKPKREGGKFDDLPYELQERAKYWLKRILDKRRRLGKKRTGWVYPLLVGQARRLAKNPPTAAWGRSMAARKGGYAVQQQYRMEGRDPTAKASRVRQARQGKPVKARPDYPNRMPPQEPYKSHEIRVIEAARETARHLRPANRSFPISSVAEGFYRRIAEQERERKRDRGW
jgi:hypothetical protein